MNTVVYIRDIDGADHQAIYVNGTLVTDESIDFGALQALVLSLDKDAKIEFWLAPRDEYETGVEFTLELPYEYVTKWNLKPW